MDKTRRYLKQKWGKYSRRLHLILDKARRGAKGLRSNLKEKNKRKIIFLVNKYNRIALEDELQEFSELSIFNKCSCRTKYTIVHVGVSVIMIPKAVK